MSTSNPNMISTIRKLTAFTLPISGSMLVSMITNFIAMLMVAKLGEKELAAGALGVSTSMTVHLIILPIFYAVGILASHYRGRADDSSAVAIGNLVKNAFWIAFSLLTPFSLLLWHADYLLLAFGQDPQLVNLTRSFFHYAALGMIPTVCGAIITQFYIGIGFPRMNMVISLLAMPATILFSYCLILGKWGFPALGLAGASCATFIVYSTIFVSILIYMFLSKDIAAYKIFSGRLLPTWDLCKKILSLGFPIGLQFGGELAAMAAATYFMGFFGTTALAASQTVSQYVMLVVMIILGLSQALSINISEAYGKKNFVLIKQSVIAAVIILSVLSIFIGYVFICYSNELTQFFVSSKDLANEDLMQLTAIFFTISAIFLYIDGLRNLFSSALRGLQDSKAPMSISLLSLWVIALPVSYLSGFIFAGGPVGLRLGFMSGFVIAAVLLGQRILKRVNASISQASATLHPNAVASGD